MTEEGGEEFAEALLPLLEIADEDDQIELTREALDFILKVFASRNRQLEAPALSKALKPVFRDKEKFMMKTIFEEKFAEGVAEGKTVEAQEMVLTVLKARFRKVSADVEKAVRAMVDLTALKSLAAHAATCESLGEFEKHLP